MSRDFLTTVASAVIILASLLSVAVTMGAMQNEINAKGESITVLRGDVRELRDGWARHLEAHSQVSGAGAK